MYRIAVAINRFERKRRSVRLLHLLGGLFLFANCLQHGKRLADSHLLLLALLLLSAICSLVYGMLIRKINTLGRYNHWLRGIQAVAFFALGLLLFSQNTGLQTAGLFLWGLISLVLLVAERKLFAGAALEFRSDSVLLPGSLWDKEVAWNELEDVSIRPDFITFHFPGNRYRQFEVLHATEPRLLQTLQDFCRKQLKKESIQPEL